MSARNTARKIGAIACHTCHFLAMPEDLKVNAARCPRCDSPIHGRKENSLSRTWALLFATAVLYVPANVFPIMTVISFGQKTSDTILSGIIHLVDSGQWIIALVVFVASVVVPIFKIAALSFLALSVQFMKNWRPRERTRLYRFVEIIGRWSMIDVFMISILIALVKLKALATVEPGPGAVAFAAVVILTMFAAMTFDPRLIWDRIEDSIDE